MNLTDMGKAAVAAKYEVQKMDTAEKNASLRAVAEGLIRDRQPILDANGQDVERAVHAGMHPGMVDRLKLTEERVEAMKDCFRFADCPILWEKCWGM